MRQLPPVPDNLPGCRPDTPSRTLEAVVCRVRGGTSERGGQGSAVTGVVAEGVVEKDTVVGFGGFKGPLAEGASRSATRSQRPARVAAWPQQPHTRSSNGPRDCGVGRVVRPLAGHAECLNRSAHPLRIQARGHPCRPRPGSRRRRLAVGVRARLSARRQRALRAPTPHVRPAAAGCRRRRRHPCGGHSARRRRSPPGPRTEPLYGPAFRRSAGLTGRAATTPSPQLRW
jgi:hypothetical protein